MLTSLFLSALAVTGAAPPAPGCDDVLAHVGRFTRDDHNTLREKHLTARFVALFLNEKANAAVDAKTRERLEQEYNRQWRKVADAYRVFVRLTDPLARPGSKPEALRRFRREIGETEWEAGVLPPPCPPKYEKEFKAWLDKKFEQGLKTPNAIAQAAVRAHYDKLKQQQKKD
jgi:hypothetical protein